MKIAVTYESRNVFQHFGHSEQFKIYEIADGHGGHCGEDQHGCSGSGHCGSGQ